MNSPPLPSTFFFVFSFDFGILKHPDEERGVNDLDDFMLLWLANKPLSQILV